MISDTGVTQLSRFTVSTIFSLVVLFDPEKICSVSIVIAGIDDISIPIFDSSGYFTR